MGEVIDAPVREDVAIARYVRPELFERLTGVTKKAVERKIAEGVWIEGREYRRAPDRQIYISMNGYYKWVEQGRG